MGLTLCCPVIWFPRPSSTSTLHPAIRARSNLLAVEHFGTAELNFEDQLAVDLRAQTDAESAIYSGAVWVLQALRPEIFSVNRKRIQRLMQEMGLQGMAPRPNTSRAHPQHPVYATVNELLLGLGDYFAFYNSQRPHQALQYQTPDAVYASSSGGGALIIDKFADKTADKKESIEIPKTSNASVDAALLDG